LITQYTTPFVICFVYVIIRYGRGQCQNEARWIV